MTDENPDNVSAGPYGDDPHEPGPADPRPIDLAEADTYAGRRVAPEDTNARLEREARPKIERADCPHCRGTGKVLTKNDQLRASLDLLGVDTSVHNEFAAEFYRRLFSVAEPLRVIFPTDLAEAASDPNGRGKGQRDKLVAALFALGQTYDPSNPEAMAVLDQHLAAFGRSHAAFSFPDGVRPPTLEEYRLVKVILFDLMIEVCADKWLDEYTAVWSEAYDYAYRRMGDAAWLWLQENDGNVHPRSVRR
jgi:hemoglobin-like flavoprotein